MIGCAGLMTDANAIASPPGALRVADNILIEQPGVASVRPTFEYLGVHDAPGAYRPRAMHFYGTGGPAVIAWDASTGYAMDNNGATVTGGVYEPLSYQVSFPQFAEARDNLYWTTKAGPYKLTSSSDLVAEKAGMHEATSGKGSADTFGTPVALPTNYATAYRWCFKKIDANDLETRSAPAPWQTVTNTSGSTVDRDWNIPLPGYVVAGDQIELYRAIAVTPSTSIPSDTMYLAARYIVTSTDITNGNAIVTDRTAETALGAELYTNPSRDGALKSNGRPPASIAMTQWGGCMWFGGIKGPWTAAIDIVTVTGATSTDALTGVQRLARVGDSNSNTTISGLVSTTSIKVGQLVTGAFGEPASSSSGVQVGTLVVAKTATTVTLSLATTTSLAGETFHFHDGVTVDGLTYWASQTTSSANPLYPSFAMTAGNRSRDTARQLAYIVNFVSNDVYAFAIEDPYYRDAAGDYSQATVVFRSAALDDAQWGVTLVGNTTLAPPAFQFIASTTGGVLVRRDDYPNGAMYSKPNEPEHVPDLNYLTIGNEKDPIYAFAPLPNALLVFKRDGLFRITGTAPDGWRVDLIEPNVRILRGECVDVLDGAAYAWTDRGVLRITDGGAQNISDGAVGADFAVYAGEAIGNNQTAMFVRTWPVRGCVVVGVPYGNGSYTNANAHLFCYCVRTGAWSRWVVSAYCAARSASDGHFYIARGGAYWEIRMDRSREDGAGKNYDREYTGLTWSNVAPSTALTITTAQRGDWVPVIGDWVSASIGDLVSYRRVVGLFNNSGISYELTLSSAFPAGFQGSRTAYEGIQSRIQWQAKSVIPTDSARVRRMHVVMDWTSYIGSVGGSTARIVAGAATDRSHAIVEGTNVTALSETREARIAVMDITPHKAIARASMWMPYLETDDIGLEWRCLGMAIDLDSVSERADR